MPRVAGTCALLHDRRVMRGVSGRCRIPCHVLCRSDPGGTTVRRKRSRVFNRRDPGSQLDAIGTALVAARRGDAVEDVVQETFLAAWQAIPRLDLTTASDKVSAAIVQEIPDVEVADELSIELIPNTDSPSAEQMPILNALEVIRHDGP